MGPLAGFMNKPINVDEVHKVKMKFTAHTIRNSAVSLFALVIFSLPLIASAGTSTVQSPNESLLSIEANSHIETSPEVLYDRLQDKSRDMCGSTDIRMTGGLKRSRNNEECYEGTLTAAVQRLDDPAVTELHIQ